MALNQLLSFAFHGPTDLGELRRLMPCGQIMIDSGAYTAHTTGKTIRLEDYAAFLRQWHGCWDHAITLDVIGDPAATRVNTRRLHALGVPVLPVFTRGDTLADFDAMVRDHSYVCVGGLVGLPRPVQASRIAMLQRRARDAGGGIHALGIGSMGILRAARPYSADASSVSGAFRFGHVLYYDGQRLRQVPITNKAQLMKDLAIIRGHGVDLGPLVTAKRMPVASTGRPALIRAMTVAYAVADEHLKFTGPVPAPVGLVAPGPHLYSSSPRDLDSRYAAPLDGILHDPNAVKPGVWLRYGAHHVCHRKETHAP